MSDCSFTQRVFILILNISLSGVLTALLIVTRRVTSFTLFLYRFFLDIHRSDVLRRCLVVTRLRE